MGKKRSYFINSKILLSLSEVLKGMATYGSAGLSLLLKEEILSKEPSVSFVIIIGWFAFCQVAAHVVLYFQASMEFESKEGNDNDPT